MLNRRWVLWQGLIAPSMEHFIVGATVTGFELTGLILQAHEEVPHVARYTIRVDKSWRTREVELELENSSGRTLTLSSDGVGHWLLGRQRMDEIDGCLDVDLEWSPSTNTLPIRRLGLAIGETRAVGAAWIRFPTFDIQRLDQVYERLEEHRYRYRSGSFTADLEVDDDGIVVQYGFNWRTVASSGEASTESSTPAGRSGA